MTELLLQIWLWGKIFSMFLSVLAVLVVLIISIIINRKKYHPIKLGNEQYWYRYHWIHGGNTAWLYKKKPLFGYKCVSDSIILSGLFSVPDYIKMQYNKGVIVWK